MNTVNYALDKRIDLKILKQDKNFISMIIETDDAYYYAEKNYENKIFISSLAIKIFKKQKYRIIHFHYVLYRALFFLANKASIDYKNFMISLRKEKIKFYKWFEKNGIINTSTY